MKTPPLKLALLALLSLAVCSAFTSCGAPDPGLQGELDRDILSAAENRGSGNSTGPQQAQGSKNYGHGGF